MAVLCERATIAEFYSRRLRRLLPAYLVTVLIATLAVVVIAVPVDANQRLHRLWFDLAGLSNVAFWLENSYFDEAAFKPLLNLWSLGVELQFYLIAPFLLPFLRKRVLLALLVLVGSLAVSLVILTISPKTSFFMMPTRLWEFLIGALVAWYPLNAISGSGRKYLSIAALLVLLGVIFAFPIRNETLSVVFGHPGLASILVATATGLLIAFGLNDVIRAESLIGRVFVRLGDYSYSIYLTHFPIIVLVNYVSFGGTRLGFGSFADLAVIVLATGISSWLMFNFVETFRFRKGYRRLTVMAVIALVLTGISGPTVNALRFSDQQRLIFAAWEDRAPYRCGKIIRILDPGETMCRIGAVDNDDRVLLLGNSHADAIKIPFAKAMDNHDLGTWFYVANNPLMSGRTGAKKIAADVERLGINTVVINYSPSFFDKEKNRERLVEFAGLMKGQSVELLFIAPVPIYDVHIPKAMYLNTIDAEAILPHQDAEGYLGDNAPFFELMAEIGIPAGDIYLPHDFLCAGEACLLEREGRPVYFDEGHLTLTGAALLDPVFDDLATRIGE